MDPATMLMALGFGTSMLGNFIGAKSLGIELDNEMFNIANNYINE